MAKCVDCLNVDSSFHVFHDTDSESFFGDDTLSSQEHENSKQDDDERHSRPLVACKYDMSLDVAAFYAPRPRNDLPRRLLEVRKPIRDELSVASDHAPRRPRRTDLEDGDGGLDRASEHGKRRVLPQRSRSAKSSVRSPVRGPVGRTQSGCGGANDVRTLPGRSRSSRQTPSKSISLGAASTRWGNIKASRPETVADTAMNRDEVPSDSEHPPSRSNSARDFSCGNGAEEKRPSGRQGRKNSRNLAACGSVSSLVSFSDINRKERHSINGQRNSTSRSPRLSSRTLREIKADLETVSRSRQKSRSENLDSEPRQEATRTQEMRSPGRIARTGSRRDLVVGNGDGIHEGDRNRRGVPSDGVSSKSGVAIREGLEVAECPLRRRSPSNARNALTCREAEKGGDEDSMKLPRHSNRQRRDIDKIDTGHSNHGSARGSRSIVAGTRGVARTRSGRRDQRELIRTQYAAAIERYKIHDDVEDEDEETLVSAETSVNPEPQELAEKDRMDILPESGYGRTSLFAMAAMVASKAAVLAVKSTTQVVGSKHSASLP